MKLLAISEHYYPRVGGTVNYLHETLSALVHQGCDVELWVPGPAPSSWLSADITPPPYRVFWLDAGFPSEGDPSRESRYSFCKAVNTAALGLLGTDEQPDLIHVMFGLYLMECLVTEAFQAVGLPVIATVHNVPPQECRQIPPNAPLPARLIESLRLKIVYFKNRARLRAHRWDLLIVPSEQVRDLLGSILPSQPIIVIPHGHSSKLISNVVVPPSRQPTSGPVRILTVGGFVPHKRQHLIPPIATRLREAGLHFIWDVVGPSGRVAGYYQAIVQAVVSARLQDCIHIHGCLSTSDLAILYQTANIYVQPSIEEGFCITALDAAAVGLPVIASPAGALSTIAAASRGALVPSEPNSLAIAILDYVRRPGWADALVQAEAVRTAFSWDSSAAALHTCYIQLVDAIA